MSSLSRFRDHCRTMAAAEHKPECPSRRPLNPPCEGCLTAADRALFAQMASEVDDYLAPQVDLFGDLSDEPIPAMGETSERTSK